MSKTNFKRHCNLLVDMAVHPVIGWLAQVLLVMFFVMFLCLGFTCAKYRKVSN